MSDGDCGGVTNGVEDPELSELDMSLQMSG
jgi:hypothetical protein